jgi:hypothetical protein
VREALDLINTAQQAATIESREGAKKLAIQQQVTCNLATGNSLLTIYLSQCLKTLTNFTAMI